METQKISNNVNKKDYLKLRKKLLDKGVSVSSWLKEKIAEEISTGTTTKKGKK